MVQCRFPSGDAPQNPSFLHHGVLEVCQNSCLHSSKLFEVFCGYPLVTHSVLDENLFPLANTVKFILLLSRTDILPSLATYGIKSTNFNFELIEVWSFRAIIHFRDFLKLPLVSLHHEHKWACGCVCIILDRRKIWWSSFTGHAHANPYHNSNMWYRLFYIP